MTIACSAPGNLLLAGEYAVLEPGGLGVTVAVDRLVRVVGREDPAASGLRVAGSWGADTVTWTAADRASSPLLDAVVRASLGESGAPASDGLRRGPDRRWGAKK